MTQLGMPPVSLSLLVVKSVNIKTGGLIFMFALCFLMLLFAVTAINAHTAS